MKPLWKFCVNLLQVRIDRPRKVFVFDYSHVENYLLTVALPRCVEVIYVPTNSKLDGYMRYGYFENVRIVLVSPAQFDELRHYVNCGWIKLVDTKVEHWSDLFVIHSNQFSRTAIYDIGFFSSGEWGRRGGIFRTYNLEEIRENTKRSNEFWQLAESILKFLVNYARLHDLRLKIFLHPWERDLIRRFGLYPPFVDYADGKNVFISNDDSASVSNFFEAKVGIITTSSILYDRLKFNLETYFFSPAFNRRPSLKHHYYHKEILPTFADYAFESLDELGEKLDRSFGVGTCRADSNQPLHGDI